MKPTAVVFDIGKVLLDFDYGIAARTLAQRSTLGEADIRSTIDQSKLLFEYETGLLTTQQFFERVRSAIGFRGGLEDFRATFADIFAPMQATIDLHAELRRRGVPTYICSNTNELAVAHIRRSFPFFAQFTGYIFSYEVRSMKPYARIFEAVERQSGRRGAELLYLDDRLENVEAGAGRGWISIHHTDAAKSIEAVRQAGLI